MQETFDWQALRVEQDGETIVAPCLSLTVWFNATELSLVLDFYQRAMDTVGPMLTHYIADSMKRPARITPRARTLVSTWVRKPAEFKFYLAEFRGAADVHGASLLVDFQAKPRPSPEQHIAFRRNLPTLIQQGFLGTGFPTSTLRVTVPVDHPLAAPDRFVHWALDFEVVKRGEFRTGGCDYSLNYDSGGGHGALKATRALCMRYPGLDHIDSAIHLWFQRYESGSQELLPLAKRAGWITLVNERAVEYLGGEAKLADTLRSDPSVKIHRLAHGLALQAGEAPRLGDRSRLDLPYRSVAAAIRPVRIDRVGSVQYPDEWMGEWLGMLDQPLPGEQQ